MSRKLLPPISFTKNKALAACALLLLAAFLSACAGGQVRKNEPVYRVGFHIQAVNPILARDLGLPQSQKGLLVVAVSNGSPAAAAGVRQGDVILGIKMPGGTVQETYDDDLFTQKMQSVPVDRPVEISVLREGKTITLSTMRTIADLSGFVQPQARPEPRTIKLAEDGSGDYRTITGALLMARPGDTVLFPPAPPNGVYGPFQVFVNDITLRSEDPKKRAAFQQILISDLTGVRLEDLAFSGSPDGVWPGIGIRDSESVTVENCAFSGYERALGISNSRKISITGNRLENNSMGIALFSSDFTLSRNLILGQPMEGKATGGIYVSGSSGEIVNNTILYHRIDTAKFINGISGGSLPQGPTINGAGVQVATGSNVSIESNIIGDNSAGIYMQVDQAGRYRVEYNDIYQNTVPTGESGKRGLFGESLFENYLTGSDWNVSRGITYKYEEAPLLSLSSWHHAYYGPNPMPLSRTNLAQDPFFSDPMRGDYHLAADSPLVGRGRAGTFIGALPPVGQGTGEGAFK